MKELIEKAIKLNEELVAKLKELKELEESNLLGADGKYFTCERKDIKIKGRITVEDNGVYLCQDEVDGFECKEKYGYKYSYFIEKGTEADFEMNDITDFKLWDYLPKEGEYFYVKPQSNREYISIAKEGEDITHSYANLNLDSKDFYWSGSVCNDSRIVELRPATQPEINILDAKLKEDGKYFDQESMSIKDIVNEPAKPAFKVGDWVLITKPKDVQQNPTWTPNMDKYDGQTLEIEEISSDGYLVIDYWEFHPDWCTKVKAQKSFKVGDWFIPTKPDDFYNSPLYWDFKMDKFIGKKLKIEAITTYGMLLSNDWKFHPDWCTKVEAPKLKVSNLCIFWNYEKTDAVIGKLTGINNKSDIPYEVGSMWSYMHCIEFESMEQYNKLIEE